MVTSLGTERVYVENGEVSGKRTSATKGLEFDGFGGVKQRLRTHRLSPSHYGHTNHLSPLCVRDSDSTAVQSAGLRYLSFLDHRDQMTTQNSRKSSIDEHSTV